LWLGGSPNQTRLAKVFVERMKVRDLEATLEPLFAAFKARRTQVRGGSNIVCMIQHSCIIHAGI